MCLGCWPPWASASLGPCWSSAPSTASGWFTASGGTASSTRGGRSDSQRSIPPAVYLYLNPSLLSHQSLLSLSVHILYIEILSYFQSSPSNLESPAPAARTRPCCWPTALRTNSDETRSGLLFVSCDHLLMLPVKEARRYDNRISNLPGLFGNDSSDPQSEAECRVQCAQKTAQRSALYPPPSTLSLPPLTLPYPLPF